MTEQVAQARGGGGRGLNQITLMKHLVQSGPSVPPREVGKSNALWDRVLRRICLLNSRWDTGGTPTPQTAVKVVRAGKIRAAAGPRSIRPN
jgi:hypothetical protein